MTRVAITTASERADRVAALFSEAALLPVLLPCVRTEPVPQPLLDQMRRRADDADLVVLTSTTALDLVWGDSAPVAPVAAVGRITAAAVRHRGGVVSFVGDSTGRSLADAIDATGMDIAFPHAGSTDPAVLRILASKAAHLEAVAVYRNRPIPPADDPVDAVAFGSPSAVRGWTISRPLTGLVVGAIGTRTAEAVEMAGSSVNVMPERPDFGLLARALREEALV